MRDLGGRVILVTRAAEDAAEWVARLGALGATALSLPCLVCEPLRDAALARGLRAALDGAAWLVVTSRRGVDAVAELAGRVPDGVRIAAVGPRTAARCGEALGRAADLVAADGTGAGLARELRAALVAAPPRPRIVVAAADRAEEHFERALDARQVELVRLAVYRTVPAPPVEPRADLAALGVDTIFLASPSAVTGLVNRAVVPGGALLISIGPSTTEAARAAGLAVAAEAARPGFEGLVEAIP